MARIVATEFVSLDGVIEDPGGSENFRYGGWTSEFGGPEFGKFKFEETMGATALLLGRITYEGFAAAWPTRDGEFADMFNKMPKYVVSKTLDTADWSNSTVLAGDLTGEVTALKAGIEGDIFVHGSAQLVQGLVEHDLLDELRLMVFPVVIGDGKQLFGTTSSLKKLRYAGTQPLDNGVVVHTYQQAT